MAFGFLAFGFLAFGFGLLAFGFLAFGFGFLGFGLAKNAGKKRGRQMSFETIGGICGIIACILLAMDWLGIL